MGVSMSVIYPATVVVLLASVLLIYGAPQSRTSSTLPPGPPKAPIFGNIFQMNPGRPWPQLLTWAKEYGSVFHLQLGPADFIALNTAEAANELLVSRSGTYSDRPDLHVAQDILSNGQRIGLMRYGPHLKAARKSFQPFLGAGQPKRLRPVQDMESRVLLYDLMNHGDTSLNSGILIAHEEDIPEGHWYNPVRRFSASIILVLTYGMRMHTAKNDPRFVKIFDVLQNFVHTAAAGKYMADSFSFLRKLPDILAPWRVAAKKMHDWEYELYGGYVEEVHTQLRQHKDNYSYTGSYLKERAESGHAEAPGLGITDDGWMRDKALAYAAGNLLEAGADTTALTLQTVIGQLLGNSEALRKAREEIDREVGPHRLPTFDDEPKLPYIVACIKESLRVRAPVPIGVPHSVSANDVWNGYHIPKGATVVGNIWAIHMNEAQYPNPTKFDPDRWIGEKKPTRWGSGPESKDRDHYAFGWGRRFCPGSVLAEATLFIALARILWGLDFKLPIDPVTKKEITFDAADENMFTEGLTSFPRAFALGFHPRSDAHEALIRAAFEDAQSGFEVMGLAQDEES